MTAIALTPVSRWSRIYGLGSVYAKTLRDSRLAFLIVAGLLGALLLSGGAAFGEAYATPESRAALAALVASLPPVLAGIYGTPFPVNIETLGGSLAWKTAASLGLGEAGNWPGATKAGFGMAAGAKVGIDRCPVRFGKGRKGQQTKENDGPDHGFSPGTA